MRLSRTVIAVAKGGKAASESTSQVRGRTK